MPHPWPCASPPPEQAFLGWPESSGSQKTSLSVLQAVHCLTSHEQVNPHIGKENYRCPKTQLPKPSRERAQREPEKGRWGGRAGREPGDRKSAPAPEVVSKSDFFQPDKWGAYSCLPDGVSIFISSPTLQLGRTVPQIENRTKNPLKLPFNP